MKYNSSEQLRNALAKIGVNLIKWGYTGGDFYLTVEGDIYEAYQKMKDNPDPNYTLMEVAPKFGANLYIWIY